MQADILTQRGGVNGEEKGPQYCSLGHLCCEVVRKTTGQASEIRFGSRKLFCERNSDSCLVTAHKSYKAMHFLFLLVEEHRLFMAARFCFIII